MLKNLSAHSRATYVCSVLLALPAWSIPVFQVQAIGPSGLTSSAAAISATGAVVGNYRQPDGTYRAFLWQDGQVTPLAMPDGSVQTWATAIGGAGQAGGYTDSRQAAQGLIWDNFGNAVTTAGAYVMGMNASGDAAGMAIADDGSGYAFVTHDGTTIRLGQPAGGNWSSANAVNAGGSAAGTAMTAEGSFRAFSATANGSLSLLSALGGVNSYASAISDTGVVAGSAQTADGAFRATTWTGSTATGLGTLGGVNSYAYAINAAGQVAGYSDLADEAGTAAFLLDNGVLHDLNGLMLPGSGWRLLAAYGMNNNGQIVGRGLFNGQEQAFMLTPLPVSRDLALLAVPQPQVGIPEPASLLLVGAPLLAYLALRTRHRSKR
jgi:probable HAF family extracellular repeat protein